MRTEAVLFDYGLTLVSFEYPTACLLDTLESVRPWLGEKAPPAEWLLFHVLHPLEVELDEYGENREIGYLDFYREAWRRAGIDLDRELAYRILDLEQRCWDRAVTVVPGALDLLDRLRARGIKLAICSNAPFPPEMMLRQVEANGIRSRMDAILFSSAVGWRKPAPELYRAALAELGVAPERAIHVGDKELEDYRGPLTVGMRAVVCTALARTHPPAEVPAISDLGELEAML